jgi:starvation-inducible DNA-binding protein
MRIEMVTTHVPTHLSPVGADVREEVGRLLQATLVELLDLSLVGKQLHWSVVGPRFHPLHEVLDALVDSWRELADTVAERAVALGFPLDGQAAAIAAASELEPVRPGPVEDAAVVRELALRMTGVVDHSRWRMNRTGELDAASQDVLIEVVRALDKQLWMVRAQSPDRAVR